MNLFGFTAHFGKEEDCRNHFKEERDKIGVQYMRKQGAFLYQEQMEP